MVKSHHKKNVILFNEDVIPCHVGGMYLQDLKLSLTKQIILDGYFYLQWMIPVIGKSKWHTHSEELTESDFVELLLSKKAVSNILASISFILSTFNIYISCDDVYLSEDFKCKYWLSGVGHEEKKLSRVMICLYELGYDGLAMRLRDLSIGTLKHFGFKTGREVNTTIIFWESIFVTNISY